MTKTQHKDTTGGDPELPDQKDISDAALNDTERAKIIYRLTLRLMLTVLGEAMRKTPLDPIDHILALGIGSANLSHIDSNPELCRQHATGIEPDALRRGSSRGGIPRALHMPAETVRRRLNALIEAQVLVERNDGLVLAADNPLRLGSNQESWLFITHQFERLVRDLKARGVSLDDRSPSVS